MRVLITGGAGFVSAYFLDFLNKHEPGAHVVGIDKHLPALDIGRYPHIQLEFKAVDMLNRAEISEILRHFKPEYILHLASVSSVAQSWQVPLDSFVNNTNIFLNLVEQVRIDQLNCRILSVGSSEEYGEVSENLLPLTEEHPLKPVSPYAVARVSQEMLSRIYAEGYGINIIITRSFNHIGPGQKDNFVISSFARQLVKLSRSADQHRKIVTGDLSVMRDFLDVRDVVRAYYLLLTRGRKGQVYNICSGHGIILSRIIDIMSDMLHIHIERQTDPGLIRPNENRKIVGSFRKIRDELGWEPQITLEESLSDMIAYWQQKDN